MSVVKLLLDTARADTELLIKNDALGDNFSIPRDVDFLFVAPDKDKADLVCNFIADNRYGDARIEEVDGSYRVLVVIHMPPQQHLICSVSGLMVCIGQLFGVEYDGWGCKIQRHS